MAINVFSDGASRGNPGQAGIGFLIYDNAKLIEEDYEYIGSKTNNEAEYMALIGSLKKIQNLGLKDDINFHLDSEFVVKQLKGEYQVKSASILKLYKQVQELIKGLNVKFIWIPRSENKKADELANKGIDEKKQGSTLSLKLDQAFFGKINCLKIQMNQSGDVYFHLGLLKNNSWDWTKVKMNLQELGEIIHVLKKEQANCSFFHSFDDKKTQIWCRKQETSFNIKVGNVSKNLSIGEYEVLRIVLEECIKIKSFI